MNIAFLTTAIHPDAGGPYESVAALARGLSRLPGVTVAVIACRASTNEIVNTDHWGMAALRTFPGGTARRVMTARSFLQSRDFLGWVDVVHGSGLWDESAAVMVGLRRLHSGPIIWSPRGMLEPWALHHHRLRKQVAWNLGQRRLLTECDALHATSPEEAGSCSAAGLRQPIAVVPNAVGIPPLAGQRDWHPGTRQCVYLGRLHPKKGLPLLLEAWSVADHSGWRLCIAGPDEVGHRSHLEALVANLGLRDVDIRPPAYGSDRWQLLLESHLFICPSYSENFGIAIAEGMASGLPVIASTGTPWQILAREQMGWWVAPEVAALRGALTEAMALPAEQLASKGQQCRLHVADNFTEARICERMHTVYSWLVRGGPLPSDIAEHLV